MTIGDCTHSRLTDEHFNSRNTHTCGYLNQLKQNNMKALTIIAKAIQICMASSVGIAVAFALYKVVTNQATGMSI